MPVKDSTGEWTEPDDDLDVWAASKPADDDGQRWKGVVGVDVEPALDANLFRVLEWGGMEVLAGQ
ncbi:hypothetical protein FB451DRAFT_1387985 [Mycena latifolia]|nr:hypothetical protein FB451DRAFT_1387985 [Mycena latifolia]